MCLVFISLPPFKDLQFWTVGLHYSYQAYLEAVLEEKDNFQEIDDIMTRHATLAATNEDLQQQQFKAAQQMDLIRQTSSFLRHS